MISLKLVHQFGTVSPTYPWRFLGHKHDFDFSIEWTDISNPVIQLQNVHKTPNETSPFHIEMNGTIRTGPQPLAIVNPRAPWQRTTWIVTCRFADSTTQEEPEALLQSQNDRVSEALKLSKDEKWWTRPSGARVFGMNWMDSQQNNLAQETWGNESCTQLMLNENTEERVVALLLAACCAKIW